MLIINVHPRINWVDKKLLEAAIGSSKAIWVPRGGVPPNQGCDTGRHTSPLLFNIAIDAVCREVDEWGKERWNEEERKYTCAFYADDGKIFRDNPREVQ